MNGPPPGGGAVGMGMGYGGCRHLGDGMGIGATSLKKLKK